MWKVILCVFMGVLILSCKDNEKESYLSELKQMEKTIDSLSIINFDSLQHISKGIIQNVNSVFEELRNNYKNDTLTFEFIQKLDVYKTIEKDLLINSGNLVKIKNAFPEIKKKINDLYHDIKNGTNDRSKYGYYIEFEKSKINDVQEIVDYYLNTLYKVEQEFDTLQPFFKKYNDSIFELPEEIE